ncbi:unnamed protein product [Hanseniaspora opuntiae]
MSMTMNIKRNIIDVVRKLPILDEATMMLKGGEDKKKLNLFATHLNKAHEGGFHVYCSAYKKKQKESWFLLGYKGDELKILKRCMPNKQGEIKSVVELDSDTMMDIQNVRFELINDALDISYKIPII